MQRMRPTHPMQRMQRQALAGAAVLAGASAASQPAYAELASGSAASQPAYADAPLNYFLHAAGPAATPTLHLGWALAALSVAVCVVIAVLLVIAIGRRRAPSDPSTIITASGGTRWVYIGTGISTVFLLIAAVYMLITLRAVAQPARAAALTIRVTGYDWWWKVDYGTDAASGQPFSTANEIHIPTGVPVKLELRSADVIHSFWVPRLAGKTQMIPGQVNTQWIQADTPGVYRGQCSQFCGPQHAHMAFQVIAQSAADFAAWQAAQRQVAPPPEGALATAGAKLFGERCAGCHTVRGSKAAGVQAPDLTHVGTRRLIAAGTVTNTPDHLLDWVRHAQRIKPDALMPSMVLTTAEAAALSAYVARLQ